jgi:gliding motility-associated-like protein
MRGIATFIIILFVYNLSSMATHNRAGEITYRHLSGLTYEFTITTYTYTPSAANRSELTIEWGDNTSTIAPIADGYPIFLPDDYRHNAYIATHTFPGPGIYEVLVQDPNRNLGVENIPNSVNVVFSIKTTILINMVVGDNSSPELLNPPKDRAALGHIFIHNPAAYDPDGDSLSYELTVCTEQDGKPIENYSLPPRSDTFYINAVNGDLIWDTPIDTGKYNVAMNIKEWRNGLIIGNIVRDMQIEVFRTDNNPPVNPPLTSYCVEAGTLIEFQVTSTDEDDDPVKQSMTGGPFELPVSPAVFETDTSGMGFATSTFRWQTTCSHVRKQPYQIVLKSEDVNNDISLVDIDNFTVKILGPAPTGLSASSTSTDINLSWDQSSCENVAGYYIYRREGSYDFQPDSCENGVPPYTGYERVGEVSGLTNNSFSDDNNGEGLIQGIVYCYMVTAFFPDRSESFASAPVCASLVPGTPSIINVSVTRTGVDTGEVYLAWLKPMDIDPVEAPGPYVFQILRTENPDENNFLLVDSVETPDLNDTTYYDNLNTIQFPYYYSVKLFNNTPGNRFEIKEQDNEIASTLYMDIIPDDNRLILEFKKKVPWVNTDYIVYRQSKITGDFDSIGTTGHNQYIDSGLKNGVEYCYKAKSIGWRPVDSVIFENENLSHVNCGIPADTTSPCPPVLTVVSLCDSLTNILTWTNPNNYCADDVIKYVIYYSETIQGISDSLAGTSPATDTTFYHRLESVMQLGGCYYVTAIDSFENESMPSNRVCVDACPYFELPNVFSPNNDGINDKFVAKVPEGIEESLKVEIKIYNRWGQLIFESDNNPLIEWDGTYTNSKKIVPSGVYYYICDVYEPRITGIEVRNLVGFVHVYTDKTSIKTGE